MTMPVIMSQHKYDGGVSIHFKITLLVITQKLLTTTTVQTALYVSSYYILFCNYCLYCMYYDCDYHIMGVLSKSNLTYDLEANCDSDADIGLHIFKLS